jgi:hypothetical protein
MRAAIRDACSCILVKLSNPRSSRVAQAVIAQGYFYQSILLFT